MNTFNSPSPETSPDPAPTTPATSPATSQNRIRSLASIQRISSIAPHPNADRLETATILGWQVVVGKGAFAPGDLCVYFEIDSFLPELPRYEFLRGTSLRTSKTTGNPGMRIKTLVLRGQLSQGLAMPYTHASFPELPADLLPGTDVTELLGIEKWEIPESSTGIGTAIGEFPSTVSKTDEARVQSFPQLIDEFADLPCEYYVTTKMDGSSCTLLYDGAYLRVFSHSNEMKREPEECPMWKWAEDNGIEEAFRKALGARSVAVQGEFCGPNVHGNKMGLKEHEFFAFTLQDPERGNREGLDELLGVCEAVGLRTVEIEERGEAFPYRDVEELLGRAKGNYPNGARKEGIVVRPVEPVKSVALGGRSLSMKILNNDFLAKEK